MRNFPDLDSLLPPAHKPIVSYVKDFEVWKTGMCKIFSFSLFISLSWLNCRGHAREGLNNIPDNRQLLKLACFVQLQPKSSSTLFPLECPALCLSLLICYTSLFYNLPCLLQRQGNSLCHSAFISFCLGNHTGTLRKGKTS